MDNCSAVYAPILGPTAWTLGNVEVAKVFLALTATLSEKKTIAIRLYASTVSRILHSDLIFHPYKKMLVQEFFSA